MTHYLDREAAIALLAANGFNRIDIECVLELTRSVSHDGTLRWQAHSIERLASRAWWLDETAVKIVMSRAA
ncbi:MAG: hypothetical protein U0987_18320 [Afipia sp.]|uniref:hypothetical protein n=1 Tax=Parvibaculum sp. TaxID=2024848 RepID=UPI00272F5DC8|nr:hypothetical protein [Parvibaculum sp.]MDP2151188.1 hypothetical protein [Parvibaculum sp.]MDZ4368953.1 hypothetical protein [Afipia sp.]